MSLSGTGCAARPSPLPRLLFLAPSDSYEYNVKWKFTTILTILFLQTSIVRHQGKRTKVSIRKAFGSVFKSFFFFFLLNSVEHEIE